MPPKAGGKGHPQSQSLPKTDMKVTKERLIAKGGTDTGGKQAHTCGKPAPPSTQSNPRGIWSLRCTEQINRNNKRQSHSTPGYTDSTLPLLHLSPSKNQDQGLCGTNTIHLTLYCPKHGVPTSNKNKQGTQKASKQEATYYQETKQTS